MSSPFRAVPDAQVREQALDTQSSFLVQAPAGSGKTELLTQRFLKLLGQVEEPERILAITFTRKAVAEMRSRIVKALHLAQSDQAPAETHKRQTWQLARLVLDKDTQLGWGLKENPSRLRILTIDALCQSLVGQTPWLSRMGGAAQVSQEPELLYLEAANRAIQQVEDLDNPAQPYWAALLLHIDNRFSQLAESLAEMLARREQWVGLLHEEPDRAKMEAATQAIVRRHLEELRPITPTAVIGLARFAESNGVNLSAWRDLRELPATDDLTAWDQLAAWLLTKGERQLRAKVDKNTGFPPDAKPQKQAMQEFLQLNEGSEFVELLRVVHQLPPTTISESEWNIICAAREALHQAHLELQRIFQERREVDFTEYALRALVSLDPEFGSGELAERMFYRTEHILVDEFQDTSRGQVELLRRLTAEWSYEDGRTLFAVGDPMQSIYLFRGADVGLYLQAQESGIGDLPLQQLRLSANFRSQRPLVDWCNQTMPHVLAHAADVSTGAVTHEASEAMRESDSVSDSEGDGEGDGAVVCAPGGAAEAAQLVANHWQQDATRSIAVLVRNRRHARAVAGHLQKLQVPFAAVEIEALGERPAIGDLAALTRAICFAADRTACLAVLRAPWCGLELADLLAIAKAAGKNMPVQSVLATVVLSEDGRRRLDRILPILVQAWEERGQTSLRAAVRRAWLQLGGPATARGPQDLEDAHSFFALLENCDEAGDLVDLSRFTQKLAELMASSQPESIGEKQPVQLMTMHKAKGLEFDVVILPELHRRSQTERTPLLTWRVMDDQLLLGAVAETGRKEKPRLTAHLMEFQKQKLANELGRLLYVAVTRAKQKLILVGEVGEQGKLEATSLLARLLPALGGDWPTRPKTEEVASTPLAPMLRRFAASYSLPAEPPGVIPPKPVVAVTETEEELGFTGFDPERLVRRAVGIVAHRMMESFGKEGLDAWPQARLATMEGPWQRALRAEGVSAASMTAALERLRGLVTAILQSPRAQWILAPHLGAKSELELTALQGQERRTLRLDRTFVDNDGIRWVVDFKTGEAEDVAREVARYKDQLNQYGQALKELGEPQVKAGLYFVAKEEWREWEVTASLPATEETVQGAG